MKTKNMDNAQARGEKALEASFESASPREETAPAASTIFPPRLLQAGPISLWGPGLDLFAMQEPDVLVYIPASGGIQEGDYCWLDLTITVDGEEHLMEVMVAHVVDRTWSLKGRRVKIQKDLLLAMLPNGAHQGSLLLYVSPTSTKPSAVASFLVFTLYVGARVPGPTIDGLVDGELDISLLRPWNYDGPLAPDVLLGPEVTISKAGPEGVYVLVGRVVAGCDGDRVIRQDQWMEGNSDQCRAVFTHITRSIGAELLLYSSCLSPSSVSLPTSLKIVARDSRTP